jgi:hypothetical protein
MSNELRGCWIQNLWKNSDNKKKRCLFIWKNADRPEAENCKQSNESEVCKVWHEELYVDLKLPEDSFNCGSQLSFASRRQWHEVSA